MDFTGKLRPCQTAKKSRMMNKKTNHKKNGPTARNGKRTNTDAPIDEQFREIEEYLDTLIYQSPAVICAHRIGDDQWEISYVSDNIEGILGFEPAELTGDFKQWQSCVHPDDIDGLMERMRRAKPRDERQEYEYRFRDKNGKYHWLYDQQKVVCDEGRTIEILSASWDITERKELEMALRESRERYQSIVQTQQEMIGRFLPDTTLTFVNDAYCRAFNKTADELIGQRFLDLVPPDAHPGILDHINKAIAREPTDKQEHRIVYPDGSTGWQEWMYYPITDGKAVTELQAVGLDITRRKHAEQKYQTLVENLNEIIYKLDDQARISYISPSIEPLAGYRPEEVLGRSFLEFVHPDDINGRIEQYNKILSGIVEPSEYRLLDKQGRAVWIRTSARPIMEGDRVSGIQGVLTDITDLKQTDAALRESQARFTQLAEQNRTVTWEVDANGLFAYVSHVAETLYGYPPEEIMGQRHFYDLHPETGREAFKASAFKIFEEKRPFNDMENQILTKDGHLIWVSTTGLPVLNDDGTLAGYRGSDTDITSRKRTEIELRESEKKFRVLANDLPALICEFLPDGTLTFVNKAYCEYFGMSARKLIGRQFLDFLPPEKRKSAKEKYMALTPRQPVAVSEFKTTRHDTPRWLEWRNRAIFDESGQAVKFQGIGLDISERKEREKQLRETSRFHEAAAELATAIANMRIDSMDEGIQQCLAILGNYLSARQGYIFSSDSENSMWTKTHEWCDKGDPSQTIPFRHLAFDTFPGLVERFARGERIALGSRAELPETMNSAWERLLKKQVKALIMQPMLVDGQLIGFLGFIDTATERIFTDTDHGLLSLAADNFAATFARQRQFLREKKANEELKHAVERANKLATTDDLTGLWNRRYFMDALDGELERARRYDHLFSLLTLDIDYFKHINDTFGHAAGDMVLQHMAEILKSSIRQPDVAARIGGEEFSLILPNTGLDDALTLAERLRWSIEKTPAAYQDREIFYTVSIGAAAYHPNIHNKDELLRLADKALYRAKNEGRNRVETEKS